GIAAGTTAAVMRGGRVQIAQIAADAFGNALGSSLAEANSAPPDVLGQKIAELQRSPIWNDSVGETNAQFDAERDTRIQQLQDMAGAELASGGAGLAYSPAFAEPQHLPVGSTAPDPSMKSIVPDPQVVARGVTADGLAWERWDTGTTAYSVDLHLDMEPGRELGPLSKAEVDALRDGPSSQGGGFLANARAGMNAFWTQVADDGVSQGSFLKYATGQTMRALGNVGYDIADKVDAAYDQPRDGFIGGAKSMINLGPDLFNGAANMTKLSLDGYSRIAEKLGAGDGAFAGFREASPYNITPIFEYDNQAQAGGGLITQTALGFGLEKYGSYNVRLNVDTSPTFYTGKPLLRLEAPNSAGNAGEAMALSGQPVPRVDVSGQFNITRYGGALDVDYLDAEFGNHGLNATIDKNGRLSFEVRAQGDVSKLGSGTDMFSSMMLRLNREGIDVNAITGTWISGGDSVNAAEFARNVKMGMTPEDAAMNTWTGRMAARYGYSSVNVPPSTIQNTQFAYFRKPTQ
ncbi:hypothetical protein, partial [Ralstonia pseudosolanacearum]